MGWGEINPTPGVEIVPCLSNRLLYDRAIAHPRRALLLCHFDLQFIGFLKIQAGNPKAGGSYLLDGRAHGIAVGQTLIAAFIFSSFTRLLLAPPGGSWQ